MRIVNLRWKPLTDEAFAPFGRIVRDFANDVPKVSVGQVVRNQVRAKRTNCVEWVSAHWDGEQILVPHEKVPTVFVVAPPSERPDPKGFRAFLSDGSAGICLSVGVWHALPIPTTKENALYDNAQGSQWHDHTVELNLPSELGIILSVALP